MTNACLEHGKDSFVKVVGQVLNDKVILRGGMISCRLFFIRAQLQWARYSLYRVVRQNNGDFGFYENLFGKIDQSYTFLTKDLQ